jgi:hypothetical protein
VLIVVYPGITMAVAKPVVVTGSGSLIDLTSMSIPLSDDYAMSVEGENSRRSITIRK